MRPQEPRSFLHEDVLDPCDEAQVQAWARLYEVPPQMVREACEQVGGNRIAIELKLSAPQA